MRSRESRSSRGFSLVEVLIIVAVLAFLMAMLLPAIQSIRASARRTDCGNNLKNLAAGIQGFHSQNGQLPPAWGAYPGFATGNRDSNGITASTAMFGSWIAHILPHIDMNAEYLRLPRAKVCLGFYKWGDVFNSRQNPASILPFDMGVELSRDDGVNFNIYGSPGPGWFATYQGNTAPTSDGGPVRLPANGTSSDKWGNTTSISTNGDGTVIQTYTTVTSTVTSPIYRYETVPATVFSMNGLQYTIWRTTQTITGSQTTVLPGTVTTQVLGNRNQIIATSDNPSWNAAVNDKVPVYFNLSGTTPYGRGYPAAQETIRVPITVCKGDNSVIESSQKLRWLGGRDWSTTNYMANPFAFNYVDGGEAVINLNAQGVPGTNDPAGWGRYRLWWGSGKKLEHIADGQSSTIMLTEAMRYCTTVVQMTGSGASDAPTAIEIARLAFWSSPKLVNTIDMWKADIHAYTYAYDLAIQPHPLSSGTTYEWRKSMPVPAEVSWKPWTHNFAVEWEANGTVDVMYANTFMFQAQPKPSECSSMRAQSNHGSLLMVAMCDGSVRAINSDISRREVTDSDIIGKQVAGAPNMGNRGAADGTWDRLVRDNDGVMVPGY